MCFYEFTQVTPLAMKVTLFGFPSCPVLFCLFFCLYQKQTWHHLQIHDITDNKEEATTFSVQMTRPNSITQQSVLSIAFIPPLRLFSFVSSLILPSTLFSLETFFVPCSFSILCIFLYLNFLVHFLTCHQIQILKQQQPKLGPLLKIPFFLLQFSRIFPDFLFVSLSIPCFCFMRNQSLDLILAIATVTKQFFLMTNHQ